jgi:16S rRNA pseudouridine516 synthase
MTRLDQLVARNLGCSRREARRLLAQHDADPRHEVARAELPLGLRLGEREVARAELPLGLRLGGREIVLHDEFHLALNKPAGLVTALKDPTHRTARELVRDAPLFPELRPAGRLDRDTTGLLIWTSDGAWLHAITHPRSRIPRTYEAALARPFRAPPRHLVLADGHRPEIIDLRAIEPAQAHPSLAVPSEARLCATITIVSGAYHEVRRIFAALDSHVFALCRVRFGRLALPRDLEPGAWRPIERGDVCPPGAERSRPRGSHRAR